MANSKNKKKKNNAKKEIKRSDPNIEIVFAPGTVEPAVPIIEGQEMSIGGTPTVTAAPMSFATRPNPAALAAQAVNNIVDPAMAKAGMAPPTPQMAAREAQLRALAERVNGGIVGPAFQQAQRAVPGVFGPPQGASPEERERMRAIIQQQLQQLQGGARSPQMRQLMGGMDPNAAFRGAK